MRKTISASWVHTTKLKTHNNLFLLDDLADDYLVRAYACKCGHDEVVTGDDIHKHYVCSSCNNEFFFDINDITPDMESFVENTYYNRRIKLNFNMKFEVGVYKNRVQAIAKIKVPSSVDFLEKKIIKDDVVVVGMPYQEKHKKIERSPFSSTMVKLQKLAIDKKQFEPFIDIKLSRSERIKRKQFDFYLNHYHLKDLKFMKWTNTDMLTGSSYTIETALQELANDKQVKSVKKAIYDNYEIQLNSTKEFNPNFINIVTSKIDNINYVVSLLKLDLKHEYFKDNELIEGFFNFLLDRYSQKQIVNYFSSVKTFSDGNTLRDTIWMYRTLKYYLDATIDKVNCSLEQIHNQFVKLSNKLEYRNKKLIEFEYSDTQQLYLADVGEYAVRLPRNNHELFAWSSILENCLASFEHGIDSQSTTVYGFFKDYKLIFAIEIIGKTIMQAHGKHNRALNSLENKMLNEWHKASIKRLEDFEKSEHP